MTQPAPARLFDVLDTTWPAAKTARAGPWTLRQGLGGGQRVSAATATERPQSTDIPLAEEGMRALGQHPLFMIREDDDALDGWLAARGYDIVDPVTMYIAKTNDLSGQLALTMAMPSWPPLAIQLELWANGGIGPTRVAVAERVAGLKTSVLGRWRDTPCGTVFAASDDDIAMLHALEVSPPARRNGVGRTLVTACANWAADNGATWLALAVTSANEAANALYQSMGMTPAAAYHYRRAAEASD